MELLERTVCPHCHGHREYLVRIIHDEFEMRPCRLCDGHGWIDWKGRESVKWGRALLDYRLERRQSLAFMKCAVGVPEHIISDCESGLLQIDDWPFPLYNIAEVQLGKTRKD